MISLFPFQIKASEKMASRYMSFRDSENRPYETRTIPTPFYQALSALTGGGKTPILADTVYQMRLAMPVEPIVLWISKGKTVVDQTYGNFRSGGKYSHLLENFSVNYLRDLNENQISDGSTSLMALATTGTFNQREQEESALKIYKAGEDRSSVSLWELLKRRKTPEGQRRDLVIVYDEGHNLSDQQIDLLFELEPEAILVASATLRTPGKLGAMIERLKSAGWSNDDLATIISSKDVVEAELVKKQIVLGGYETTMDLAIDPLLERMKLLEERVEELSLDITPKAIYVCKTNINQEEGTPDDPARDFAFRKAPPILIWKHLVDNGVDPADIAVYCDLKFVKDFPPPDNFMLFSKGDSDFDEFQNGNFKHIIFNLSLQEGWDDPNCYFAYIDKSMESSIQVEQVIGRVLRQPNATHCSDLELNTAHFYIRMDDRTVFPEIIEKVRSKIATEFPEIELNSYSNSGSGGTRIQEPVKEEKFIPQIHIEATSAIIPIQRALNAVHDYRNDAVNTKGQGIRAETIQKVASSEQAEIVNTLMPQTNKVTARWIIDREIQKLYPRARGLCLLTDPKLDARAHFTSPAHLALKDVGNSIVDAYINNAQLISDRENLFEVGPVMVNPDNAQSYVNSLHSRYSGLNSLELDFAKAIDNEGHPWVRNPSNGGYFIPLLSKGTNRNFFPDFIVWKDNKVIALDPKAENLIMQDSGRKLFDIRNYQGQLDIVVRLFTMGEWTDNPINRLNEEGYTVWSLRAGRVWGRHFTSIQEAVHVALN
ncbi:DEAD/DEAH box helicase family protein [Bacillus sp. RAR_GA_16]|uniref:DEAD/DEAH box helicase family protein n=1 Tax=Bacillus sp. RAR_GA_16 TaxID=2876774 RepID=UPI001CCB4CD2|nr:DEAD/DEAH box helicase family protein [Bacillus sp. RAR_GA_16]MCA0174617.1 DEAD/DEAH box helicase family protein [Bacillus sp. RAR_GA_16]